jgi:hypothetical protein
MTCRRVARQRGRQYSDWCGFLCSAVSDGQHVYAEVSGSFESVPLLLCLAIAFAVAARVVEPESARQY